MPSTCAMLHSKICNKPGQAGLCSLAFRWFSTPSVRIPNLTSKLSPAHVPYVRTEVGRHSDVLAHLLAPLPRALDLWERSSQSEQRTECSNCSADIR